MFQLQNRFVRPVVTSFRSITENSPKGELCEKRIRGFEQVLKQAYAAVDRVRPPEEVEDLHERFLDEGRKSIDRVHEAGVAVEEGDLSCGAPMYQPLGGLDQGPYLVLVELNERGYRVLEE